MKQRLFWGSLAVVFLIVEVFLQVYFRRLGWGIGNSGVSFGWFREIPPAFILLVIFVVWGNVGQNQTEVGWRLVVWGGVVNLVARLVLGGVVWDYLPLPLLNLWFNGADGMITAGIIWAVVEQGKQDKRVGAVVSKRRDGNGQT